MLEVIQEAAAEAVTIAYLKDIFQSIDETIAVSTSVKPGDCVRVTRTGGVINDLVIGTPQMTFESYADTSVRAERIALLTGAYVAAMAHTTQSGVPVYDVRPMSGIASLPDPNTSRARYTQTFAIGMRASAI